MDGWDRLRAVAVVTGQALAAWILMLTVLFEGFQRQGEPRAPLTDREVWLWPDGTAPVTNEYLNWIGNYSTFDWGAVAGVSDDEVVIYPLFQFFSDKLLETAILIGVVSVAAFVLLATGRRIAGWAHDTGHRAVGTVIAYLIGSVPVFIIVSLLQVVLFSHGIESVWSITGDWSVLDGLFTISMAALISLPLVAMVSGRYLTRLERSNPEGSTTSTVKTNSAHSALFGTYLLGSVLVVELVALPGSIASSLYLESYSGLTPRFVALFVGIVLLVIGCRWLWIVVLIVRTGAGGKTHVSTFDWPTTERPLVALKQRFLSVTRVRLGLGLLLGFLLSGGVGATVFEQPLWTGSGRPDQVTVNTIAIIDAIGSATVLAVVSLLTAVVVGVFPAVYLAIRQSRGSRLAGILGRCFDACSAVSSFLPIVVVGIGWFTVVRPVETDVAFMIHAGIVGGTVIGLHAYRHTYRATAASTRQSDDVRSAAVAGGISGTSRLGIPTVATLVFVGALSAVGSLDATTSISQIGTTAALWGSSWMGADGWILLVALILPAVGVLLLTDGVAQVATETRQ